MSNRTPEIVNKKAKFEYFLQQEFEAGIQLTGTEVKSLRAGNAHMKDAFCIFEKGELYVRNLYIAEYVLGTHFNHEPTRKRKLLLRKTELKKIAKRVNEKGFTIVPYRLYWSERGMVKLEIYLASGKKSFDKRQVMKERDAKRSLDRLKKSY